MTSIAEKRRRKRRAKITLPGGAEVPQRIEGPGRPRKLAEDARQTALQARMRVYAGKDGPKDERASGEPLWTCAAGRSVMGRPDQLTLWDAICWARGVTAAYGRAIGAPQRHAKSLSILTPADIMHADATTPPADLREPEEVYRQAVAAWVRLKGWMHYCDYPARAAFVSAVMDEDDREVSDTEGLINVLLCISEGKAGNKVTLRDRAVILARRNVGAAHDSKDP